MGCINVCLERKEKGGYRVKPVLGICLVEATRCKCGDSGAVSCWWSCFLLVDCCGLMAIVGSA